MGGLESKESGHKSIQDLANELVGKYKNLKDLVLAIDKIIVDNANSLPQKYFPKSIIESRFTPAEEALRMGMWSCGATVNIATEILKHMGYKIKLIHGESEDSVDHAWFSVFDPETNDWIDFDLTQKDAAVPETHIKKTVVDSWEDIREQIVDDHATMLDRRQVRNID